MKRWKVTYEYRGRISVEVMAETEQDAKDSIEGLEQADEGINCHLSVYSIVAKPINDNYHNGKEDDYHVKD